MTFRIKILGTSSAIPVYNRNHTSQIVEIQNHHYLIDCGEATQHQISKYKYHPQRLEAIFISHLHGDHILGLMGLLSTMNLQGRTKKLDLFGPRGLKEILQIHFRYANFALSYKVNLTELSGSNKILILENEHLTVKAFPLIHRIETYGFLFEEKSGDYRIIKEKLPEKISITEILKLKKGKDIMDENDNVKYKASDYTLPPYSTRSYAYCSDTRYNPNMKDYFKDVDVMYHEATFLEAKDKWAKLTYHSTTIDAAKTAKAVNARKLLIGHYSARYKVLDEFYNETSREFPNVELAREGKIYEIEHE